MLDLCLSTIPQHQWISKLFGYDFKVEYRPGKLNTVADALSRKDSNQEDIHVLSAPSFSFYDDLQQELSSPQWAEMKGQIEARNKEQQWQVTNGLILHSNCVFLPPTSPLLDTAPQMSHASHEGTHETLHRFRATIYVEHDRQLVKDYVKAYAVCQKNKVASLNLVGLLQPLSVPLRILADISIDFVEALPKVHGKSVILTVVDRFSKYTHFIPLGHPYTASSADKAFFQEIVRLHGILESIVSDRYPLFTGHVWHDLFKLAGVQLKMSTTFHP